MTTLPGFDAVMQAMKFFTPCLFEFRAQGAVFAANSMGTMMIMIMAVVFVMMVAIAVHDIAIKGKGVPHSYVQFAQANLLSTSVSSFNQ